jgi:hypothetical protein
VNLAPTDDTPQEPNDGAHQDIGRARRLSLMKIRTQHVSGVLVALAVRHPIGVLLATVLGVSLSLLVTVAQ